jgi:phosphoglycolate phosphatase-like HAD superfamily hydrolase
VAALRALKVVAVDLDAVLGDTRPLWRAWLESASHVLELGALPEDRLAAAAELDARAGNWRTLLHRFAEDHAPVYLRPDAPTSAALRRLHGDGVRLAAFTDAPEPLARIAAAHLGAARRLEALEAGPGALERLLERLGADARIVRRPAELAG